MDRTDFMNHVYWLLSEDTDNNRANSIIDAADEYAESVAPKWIPVNEKLPEEYYECFVTYKTVEGGSSVTILGYSAFYEFDRENNRYKGEWISADDGMKFTDGEVVAWMVMNLPEPWKGEQNGKVD